MTLIEANEIPYLGNAKRIWFIPRKIVDRSLVKQEVDVMRIIRRYTKNAAHHYSITGHALTTPWRN